VVLGAVLNLALPTAASSVPSDAVILGSEPLLVEAFARLKDWLSGDALTVTAEPVGAWWRLKIRATGERRPLAVPEMGEPLIRLIVDTQLNGWLDSSPPDGVDLYLPAYRLR